MRYSEPLVEFVKRWEGLKLTASPDPLVPNVWDIGYGHVLRSEERPVWTREKADEVLRADLASFSAAVEEMVAPTLAQHEHDALTSLAFNVGVKALSESTLIHKLNNGDFDGASAQFQWWRRAGGRVIPGLIKRRAAERAMFDRADYSGEP